MDFATAIGLVSAHIVVAIAIVLGGNALGFVDLPAMAIVFGGSITVTLTRFTFRDLIMSLGLGTRIAFSGNGPELTKLIEKIAEMADVARRKGPLGLELVDVSDPFLDKGVRYITDGYDANHIREALELDRENLLNHLRAGCRVYKAIGDAAPAFGMIGTLVGLVQMLGQMDDPSKIGPSMALALLTTLYGALIANLIALPIRDKLATKITYIEAAYSLIIDGVLLIRQSKSPSVISDMLIAYLPERERKVVLSPQGAL